MSQPSIDIPVTISGGGPVGLFLGICLLKSGIDCRILEKREHPVSDSRSLGIHPVSLALFDKTGITKPFLEKGLKIQEGIALNQHRELGRISFKNCPGPHNYILSCPQFYTEEILRDEIMELNPDALLTGTEFIRFSEEGEFVITKYKDSDGQTKATKSSFLIGCDGKNSAVRKVASIHYSGKRYPDTYIMGDFKDNTSYQNQAAVFLPPEGLIECFPLPNGMRRWVVKTKSYIQQPAKALLAELIQQRIGKHPGNDEPTMLSSFGVQHFMAESLVKNRVLLVGDAAHVISPIGGQGMNLGWLGAWKAASTIQKVLENGDLNKLNDYGRYQKRIATKAAKRAEINMKLGRQRRFPVFRDLFLRCVLHTSLGDTAAELFTMRHLEDWWL